MHKCEKASFLNPQKNVNKTGLFQTHIHFDHFSFLANSFPQLMCKNPCKTQIRWEKVLLH